MTLSLASTCRSSHNYIGHNYDVVARVHLPVELPHSRLLVDGVGHLLLESLPRAAAVVLRLAEELHELLLVVRRSDAVVLHLLHERHLGAPLRNAHYLTDLGCCRYCHCCLRAAHARRLRRSRSGASLAGARPIRDGP